MIINFLCCYLDIRISFISRLQYTYRSSMHATIIGIFITIIISSCHLHNNIRFKFLCVMRQRLYSKIKLCVCACFVTQEVSKFVFLLMQVDGDLLDRRMNANHGNAYTSILFYASRCPFSRAVRPKFDILSSMFPQIKHLIVEQSQALPS